MAKCDLISFRPIVDNERDFAIIRDWCEANSYSFSSVLNSFLPAMAYALQNDTFIGEDGDRYIRADFGDIKLLIPNFTRSPYRPGWRKKFK